METAINQPVCNSSFGQNKTKSQMNGFLGQEFNIEYKGGKCALWVFPIQVNPFFLMTSRFALFYDNYASKTRTAIFPVEGSCSWKKIIG